MAQIFKWLSRLFGAMAVLAALAAALVWVLLGGSLPDYDRDFTVEGVEAPVTLLRDIHAVPHIRGASEADVFFGLGFAHAQDRLWQMETSRRAAEGRLSELFGDVTLPVDRFMRALDLHGLARRALPAQTPEARAALEAYATGVNAFIRAVSQEALGRGAPEFYFFADRIAPWTPADSLAIAKLMALRLSDQAAVEVRRAAISLRLPPERLRDLLPDYPEAAVIEPRQAGLPDAAPRGVDFAGLLGAPTGDAPAAVPTSGPTPGAALPALSPGASGAAPQAAGLAGLRFPAPLGPPTGPQAMPPAGKGGASNGWALGPSRAAAGAPILANDPHLWLSAPSLWYLARLELPSGGIIGATVPGMPLVLVGRNSDFAWGLTSAYVDDADIYIEKLDPEDPSRYLTPDGPAPFAERREIIGLPDGAEAEVLLRWTRHGPVIPPDQLGVGDVTPEGHVAALAWTALGEGDTSFSAGFALMKSRSIDEGAAAMADHVAPAMNVMLADRDDVGMIVAGRAPLRNPASPGRGRLPAPGWIAANDWQGFRDPETLPRILRPESGAVANANNRTEARDYPRHLSFHWGDPYRIRRLEKQLAARDYHSRDSAAALQNDDVSEMARAVLPLIASDLWWTGPVAPEDPIAARRQQALEMLGDWNGEMSEHAPEPLIFAEWMRRLTPRLIEDELGPDARRFDGPQPVFVERVFRNLDGAGVWCDIDKTSAQETCAQIAQLALDDALGALSERYGSAPRGWRWGEAHEARHDHEVLGRFGLLGLIANIRHETSGGDFTLRRSQSQGGRNEPHAARFGAGLRMVVDFADPDSSRVVISTGQSGHPFSRHYDDLNEVWRRGDTIRMSLDFQDAEAGALGLTRLSPPG
ncbi:penicillin amidase [Albimonas donghaensis]|uniref:Penicillin amidase n=1 Tax=Albimonas donghaensis TaxID=356660 RepID=A0A1H3EZT6_9RHOB|nr:penicillin acylase family protein [Albimonas donghaensis]SDX83414.1 penicillin amidase [Albimonas donghaensis]